MIFTDDMKDLITLFKKYDVLYALVGGFSNYSRLVLQKSKTTPISTAGILNHCPIFKDIPCSKAD